MGQALLLDLKKSTIRFCVKQKNPGSSTRIFKKKKDNYYTSTASSTVSPVVPAAVVSGFVFSFVKGNASLALFFIFSSCASKSSLEDSTVLKKSPIKFLPLASFSFHSHPIRQQYQLQYQKAELGAHKI